MNAEQKLNELRENAKSYNQSDVLGALKIAQEELFFIDDSKKRSVIVVLSDMVHSTPQMRFESDKAFGKTETARNYAEMLALNSGGDFRKGEIYVGFLESSDWRKIADERRAATREFWREYFSRAGNKRLQFATDGTGQLENFIAGHITQNSLVIFIDG